MKLLNTSNTSNLNNLFKIYPNPCNDFIILQSDEVINKVIFTDCVGNVILIKNNPEKNNINY